MLSKFNELDKSTKLAATAGITMLAIGVGLWGLSYIKKRTLASPDLLLHV